MIQRVADWHGEHACKAWSEFQRWDNKHDVTAKEALDAYCRHVATADRLRVQASLREAA
jgi:hypothetical protein